MPGLDHELIRRIRRLDEHDLRRVQIYVGGLLATRSGEASAFPGPRQATARTGRVGVREQWVRCGKASCSRCPHGPYWYAYWREDGRVRSRYVGKHLSTDVLPPGARPSAGSPSADRRRTD